MKADDIKDQVTLKAWLADRPREEGIWLAHRAAMRVLPLLANWPLDSHPRSRGGTELPFLRALLTSGVGYRYVTPQVSAAAASAGEAANAAADAWDEFAAGYAAAYAALCVISTEYTAEAIGTAAARAVELTAALMLNGNVLTLNGSPFTLNSNKAADAFWAELQSDANAIILKQNTSVLPMWSGVQPDWFNETFNQARARWQDDPNYAFWLRWYEAALAGTPPNWPFLHDIALIPNEDWEQGITHIAGLIAGIELQHAIAATPNGEDIIADPQTGLLQIVAVTDLPADIATYARRKIIRATEVFGATPENQYAALPADLAMLRAVVADPEATPVELFDACASASRRLRARIEQGSCPAADKDPLIEDYSTRIRDAGADILANDPQTQNMLTARNAIAGNNAMQEGAADIAKLVALIEPLTIGRLTVVLSSDATVSADPKANPEDRKDASIRLSSRVLRIGKILVAGTAAAGATIIGTKEVIEAIPVILASPYYQAAMQSIFKFLGY